jgi:AcrR family transcriptional regulator
MEKEEQTQRTKRVELTRERILKAAAEIFSAEGYTGATTRAISESAGVSELTLFRHFGSKKNLFLTLIQLNSAIPAIESTLSNSLTGSPQDDLRMIGTKFLRSLLEKRKSILMTLCEAERFPEVRQGIKQIPDQQRQLVARYLDTQMEKGILRRMDPEIAAQAFLGMLFSVGVMHSLQEIATQDDEQVDDIVEKFVAIFLDGLRVK